MIPQKNKPVEKSEKFGFSSGDFDASVYQKVAWSAQLHDIGLIKSTFEMKPECLPIFTEEPELLKHSFGGYCKSFHIDEKAGLLSGIFSWEVSIKYKRIKAVKLSCQYMLVYSGLIDHPEKYVRLYFEKLGKFTSYPYFRTLFSVQSQAAGIMLPPLPSLTDRMD